MFEQTLLTHPASARKTGALAASFLAQTAVFGVLLVGPLLYTQALPMVPVLTADIFTPKPVTPPPLEPVAVTSTSSAASDTLRPIFVPPTRVPTGPVRTTQVEVSLDTTAIVVDAIPNVGVATISIPSVFAEPAPIAVVVKPTATVPVPDVKPVPISGGVLASKLIKQVIPKYPPLARQIRVSGRVHLAGIIAKDGHVRDLRILDGHPLLRQAAFDAVSQWIYSPTILSGSPVEVEAPIEVNFTLR